MTLEEILDQWKEDCALLRQDLREAALTTPYVLGTYEQIYALEMRDLRKARANLERLYALMWDWLYAYPTVKDRCQKIGLEENPKKPLDKASAERMIKTHPKYVAVAEVLGEQETKVGVVRDLLDSIKFRNKTIENMIYLQRNSGGLLLE